MSIVSDKRFVLLLVLALVMAATRFHFPTPVLHLADASWAVFFLGGFYLAKAWRWALPLLFVEAVAIDYAAIQYLGVSNFCVTVAYWFLLPAYAALWFGGVWLNQRQSLNLQGFALAAISLLVSESLCFAISNGSFYWLGRHAGTANWSGYVANFEQWYFSFLRVPFEYVAAAAVLHVLIVKLRALNGGAQPVAG